MTAQIPERLILEGADATLFSCPDVPEGHPRITAKQGVGFSTSCWRGYRGTWEIRDGRLLLVGLEGRLGLHGAQPIFGKCLRPEDRIKAVQHLIASIFTAQEALKVLAPDFRWSGPCGVRAAGGSHNAAGSIYAESPVVSSIAVDRSVIHDGLRRKGVSTWASFSC